MSAALPLRTASPDPVHCAGCCLDSAPLEPLHLFAAVALGVILPLELSGRRLSPSGRIRLAEEAFDIAETMKDYGDTYK